MCVWLYISMWCTLVVYVHDATWLKYLYENGHAS